MEGQIYVISNVQSFALYNNQWMVTFLWHRVFNDWLMSQIVLTICTRRDVAANIIDGDSYFKSQWYDESIYVKLDLYTISYVSDEKKEFKKTEFGWVNYTFYIYLPSVSFFFLTKSHCTLDGRNGYLTLQEVKGDTSFDY